jgi:hypothetical protein
LNSARKYGIGSRIIYKPQSSVALDTNYRVSIDRKDLSGSEINPVSANFTMTTCWREEYGSSIESECRTTPAIEDDLFE